MALEHRSSGEPIDLDPASGGPDTAVTTTLAKTDRFKAMRLVLRKGHELPTHEARGPITFQCLAGRLAFTSGGTTRELVAGHWLFLDATVPHSVVALEDSSALLTLIL